MAALLALSFAFAGAWEAFGPSPEGHRLANEQLGADLVRAEWESPGIGRYWIDVTPDRGGSAFCRGGGLVLQVRRSLDDHAESFVLDDVPPPVASACERLEAAAPGLLPQMAALGVQTGGPGPDGVPSLGDNPGEGRSSARLALFAPRWMHGVVLAAAAFALAVAAGTRRRAWAYALPLFGLALGLRLALARPTALLGGDAAYERLVSALGRGETDRYYGDTWMSLFGLVHEVLVRLPSTAAGPTDFVHTANLLVSSAAPVLVAGVAVRLGLSRPAAVAAGLALACFPHAIHLARVEDHAPLVATLQLVAGWAALGARQRDAGLAVAAAVLLAHLRPDQLPVAAVLLLPLATSRRASFAAGAALMAARLLYLPDSTHNPIALSRLLHPSDLPTMLRAFTAPWGVAGAAAGVLLFGGLVAGAPRWRESRLQWRYGWAALVFLATTLPYLPKSQPDGDPMRFALPGASWLFLLTAAAVPLLVGALHANRGPVGRRILYSAAAVALLGALAPRHTPSPHPRPWAWEEEYRFLTESLPPSASGQGWYDASQDPNGAFGLWMQLRTGIPWRAWGSGRPAPGDLVVRGTADRLAASWAGAACGLDVLQERHAAPLSDGWVDFGRDPVVLALYSVRDCAGVVAR